MAVMHCLHVQRARVALECVQISSTVPMRIPSDIRADATSFLSCGVGTSTEQSITDPT